MNQLPGLDHCWSNHHSLAVLLDLTALIWQVQDAVCQPRSLAPSRTSSGAQQLHHHNCHLQPQEQATKDGMLAHSIETQQNATQPQDTAGYW